MYEPRYNKPLDWGHEEFGDCCWRCGCSGVGLDCLVDGVEAVAMVLARLGELPRPHQGTAAGHIAVAAAIFDTCHEILVEVMPDGYPLNGEDVFRIGIGVLDLEQPDVGRLQQPLRVLADGLREVLRAPARADERHVARDVLRVMLAARSYAIQIELLHALVGLDLGWDLDG